jgi:hypothetical protein
MPVEIEIPITIDASGADVELFGSTFTLTGIDYNLVNQDNAQVTAAALSAALLYKDTDSGDSLFAYDSAAMADLSGEIDACVAEEHSMTEGEFAAGTGTVANGSLGEVYVQWIAKELFGNAAAQAPISNDAAIVSQVHGRDYGNQFTSALVSGLSADVVGGTAGASNAVVKVIYEQLLKQDESRFDDASHDTLTAMPFQAGDSIKFIVSFTAINSFQSEGADTVGGITETAVLPDGLGTVTAVKFGLKLTLA